MGAYFRMSDAVLDCPCAVELGKAGRGDHCGSMRVLLFIRLLVWSLSPSKEFRDAAALAAMSGAPDAQAQMVWDACIRHGVLRKASYGYSARSWMAEAGLVGRYKKESDRAFDEGVYGSM